MTSLNVTSFSTLPLPNVFSGGATADWLEKAAFQKIHFVFEM